MTLTDWLDNTFYPDHARNWDDQIFREHILDHLKPEHSVLDMGAGAGIVASMNFRGLAKSVVGIDLDPRVEENEFLDSAVVGDVTKTPFEDASFDVIICDNVMEHIEFPVAFLAEVSRLLKPGGIFLGKTPNKFHYMPLTASCTPLWFHRFFNRMRGRAEEDTFPTFYRLNAPNAVANHAHSNDLGLEAVKLVEGRPEYLRIFPPFYLVGIIYERLVNRFKILKRFSILLMVTIKKTALE